jgi:hypothetical protein
MTSRSPIAAACLAIEGRRRDNVSVGQPETSRQRPEFRCRVTRRNHHPRRREARPAGIDLDAAATLPDHARPGVLVQVRAGPLGSSCECHTGAVWIDLRVAACEDPAGCAETGGPT